MTSFWHLIPFSKFIREVSTQKEEYLTFLLLTQIAITTEALLSINILIRSIYYFSSQVDFTHWIIFIEKIDENLNSFSCSNYQEYFLNSSGDLNSQMPAETDASPLAVTSPTIVYSQLARVTHSIPVKFNPYQRE